MSVPTVLLPLFVEVVLTFILLFTMAFLRVSALRQGVVRGENVALREPNWPRRHLQVQYAVLNQFEVPVLFYVLTILVLVTRTADIVFVALAWVFVLSRLVHAYIHVTTNNIRHRGPAFGLGAFVLAIMWVLFMIRILLAA